MTASIGLDFGTSNSAVAALDAQGTARALPLEGAATLLPTAVFFDAEERSVHFGREAMAQYLAGTDGRLLRSLKSLLGSALMQEQTAVGWGSQRYQDIVTRFLAELAHRSGQVLGAAPRRVVLGRPVHFVDDAPDRDRQAQQSLAESAAAAGFREVAFELEPIAAAFDYERRLAAEALVLVVDVGGGTSDFTVVRLGPGRTQKQDRSADVLATAGVHVGGTDFDRLLNLARVMPLLGLGHAGPQGRPVPSGVFHDLATWHLINFLYAPRSLARTEALRGDFADLQLHQRLMTVLRERLGHRIATETEAAKIACSDTTAAAAIPLDSIEAGLASTLSPAQMEEALDGLLAKVVGCAQACVAGAGLGRGRAVDAIYLTGGSSALKTLQSRLSGAMPGTPLVHGDLFGGVAAGLAYAAGRRWRD